MTKDLRDWWQADSKEGSIGIVLPNARMPTRPKVAVENPTVYRFVQNILGRPDCVGLCSRIFSATGI